MIKDKKPLDLLVVQSPSEYYRDFTRKERYLSDLSDLCRAHNVPVRAIF